MHDSAGVLLTVGSLLLVGLLTSAIAKRSFLPRVTLLLLFGAALGQDGLNLIPTFISEHFDLIADMTLVMIGFLLGGKITREFIGSSAKEILSISILAAVVAAIAVTVALIALGIAPEIALILGCISAATDPAAVLDVIEESSDKSKFSKSLVSIVALDDVWGLILFAIGLSFASVIAGGDFNPAHLFNSIREIVGAVILGAALGLPASYLTGRYKKGQPMLSEALGLVFLCGGLAMWFGFSFLIASIVMGTVIANVAKHHEYPFHAINDIESPFLVVFFILAGASLEFSMLSEIGLIGLVFIVFRTLGKFGGAYLGGVIGQSSKLSKQWMGVALLPQAGVAIGIALVAANQFPEARQMLLSIVISATVIFEIIGPVLTRIAIKKAGETHLLPP